MSNVRPHENHYSSQQSSELSMGLKGDLQEVATVWEKSSWRVKTYLLLSAFLASGSIASLSDTVFRWRGFIRDALFFYQTYVSDQLLRVLHFLFPAVQVPSGVPHLLILSALYLGANLRVAAFSVPAAKSLAIASRSTAGYLGVMIAMFIGMIFTDLKLNGENAWGLFLGSAFGASVSYWLVGGAARILWFAYLLGPFSLVGIVAAVSSGLVRVA
jgi:hypothetical protein